MTTSEVLLRVRDLAVDYRVPGGAPLRAVDGVSFTVRRGETLGLVGESGCGKSSTARAVMMLRRPTGGRIEFDGQDLARLPARQLRRLRPQLQMIFQDPASSLNPRRTVAAIVAEGLAAHRHPRPWTRLVDDALSAVGLDPEAVGHRRPTELSGGQCQRVALARALVLAPALVVCDEPVSALDVSVQAQILNLLEDTRRRHRLSLLFIAHDLAVVKQVSDRVGVMYLGRICELAPAEQLYRQPRHPYTRALLDAVPLLEPVPPSGAIAAPGSIAVPGTVPTPGTASTPGEPPSPLRPPSGCRFRTRCDRARDRCAEETPPLHPVTEDHQVACHYPLPG
ncbi:peptide ABC transporter ATP-binding protein [Parafrankia colletiae]|uniref:Peptide ABC transporter ATP-binding protein n=1 Tax=Parafrankia colletiae TaxID=573497 RepID=A0A1S1R300_9ACTN|nr:ABC transporter ATP-binding protein [Parafrankia colletiae]MCK9900257.1 ABC transporter ATP-binding protein [Frankia sp. Cpl3]OHV40297.1 peptide ABC transporter ATP-binding protein [Parafrankia colletiae]